MSNGLILAIDQGTTNTKALAFDAEGGVVASSSVPMAVSYPQPGWAEQSATDIWHSVLSVISEVVAKVGPDMDALAISNQRETIVVWDSRTGQPIAPAILWQCRRSAPACAAIRAAGHGALIEARTGLGVDPLFPAAKLAWILDHVAGAREAAASGHLRAGTIDAWLLWNFTGGEHATDHSNASRTQLFNTEALGWDEELGRIFNVPLSLLPRVRASDSAFGTVIYGVSALAAGVPIHAMIGDSHAALFGHGVREPGTVKATYGTGTSLMTLTSGRIMSRSGLSSTIAWSTSAGVAYALEGNISVSGQAVAFMGSLLGLSDPAAVAALALTVPDSNGVTFVPALVGLGAPYWDPDARGSVSGLSLGTTPAHLARAAIEAIAFQVTDVFTAIETDLGQPLARLSADGGAARNDMLMQFQADLIDRPVLRGELPEVSAAGAALLATTGLGRNTARAQKAQRQFIPQMPEAQRQAALSGWLSGVGRVLQRDAIT